MRAYTPQGNLEWARLLRRSRISERDRRPAADEKKPRSRLSHAVFSTSQALFQTPSRSHTAFVAAAPFSV